MDPKRISKFKFASSGPIRVVVKNQFNEEYELDVSVNVQQLLDTGVRDGKEDAVFDIRLAVTYVSQPRSAPTETADGWATGPKRPAVFRPTYPGSGRLVCKDGDGRDVELSITPTIVQIEDLGTRDQVGRTEFAVHVSQSYSHMRTAAAPSALAHVTGG